MSRAALLDDLLVLHMMVREMESEREELTSGLVAVRKIINTLSERLEESEERR